MINTTDDIKKFVSDKSFKKIFIICGRNSFYSSGAEKFLKNFLITKEKNFFYKNSEIPIFEELINIINNVRKFKPDLILAVGGVR